MLPLISSLNLDLFATFATNSCVAAEIRIYVIIFYVAAITAFLCVSLHIAPGHRRALLERGSFQKFWTLYVCSLKMNLFYEIYLQAFNVISIVLYQSGPTLGQVLYSCQDAFVVDASDYSAHLIRHLLNAFQAFPTEWFLQFREKVKICWAHVRTVRRVGNHLPSILFQNFR